MKLPEFGADLCAEYARRVYGGWLDEWTYVRPGAWRGTAWPCSGRHEATGTPESGRPSPVVAIIVCTCQCHRPGGTPHELPGRSNRTGVHPTEL